VRFVSSGRAFLLLPKSLALTGLKPPSNIKMVLFGNKATDFSLVEYKGDYRKLLYISFSEPYSALLNRLDAVKKTVEKIKAPSMNSVWTVPSSWNPTKWRGLATSATRTFHFKDIDGNSIKKQFRYVAKSYDRK